MLHDRVELDRLYLIWPTVPHFHDDDAALLLLGDILARGRSSRLYRKLVLEEEIAQDVTALSIGPRARRIVRRHRDAAALSVARRGHAPGRHRGRRTVGRERR